MKKSILIEIFLFSIISIVFCIPILRSFHYWGHMDWDQFTFWNAVPRETLLHYKQFPLWNPYANGGNVLLAHPDSPFLSPFYGLVLLFGPIIGLKIELIIHLIVGLLGMFLLSQHLKLTRFSSYFSAFIYMFSSIYVLHLSEGQTEWFALSYVPWAFMYFLMGMESHKKILGTIAFLTLMIFTGVYVFNIFIIFLIIYVLLKSAHLKSILPLKLFIIICIGTFCLSAVKLLPMLEFLNQYPKFIDQKISGVEFDTLLKILLSRDQASMRVQQWDTTYIPGKGFIFGWHEYGAYIGIIPLLIACFGISKNISKRWPLLLTASAMLFISLGNASPIKLWNLIHMLPVYKSLTVPSRYIFGFIFPIAIFAGYGLNSLEELFLKLFKNRKILWHRLIVLSIVLFVLGDLILVNFPIFMTTFRLKPFQLIKRDQFVQSFDKVNFYAENESRSSQMPIFLSNRGVLDAYECVNITRGDVLIESDPNYKGEAYFEFPDGKIIQKYFSPNKIILSFNLKRQNKIILNQNYYVGWKVEKSGLTYKAQSYNGLISFPVTTEDKEITFYYFPLSFLISLFISLFTFIIMCIYGSKNYFNSRLCIK